MSTLSAFSLKLEWSATIYVVIYGEKITSMLYVAVFSIFQLQILYHFEYCPYYVKMILTIIFVNICYIGYRCVLWVYSPFFTEYVTLWISLQIINTLVTKCVIYQFNEDWNDDDKFSNKELTKPKINSTQDDCYNLKQKISLFYLYMDNISTLYNPNNRSISDKSHRLIKYIAFHLALILQLLILKTNIVRFDKNPNEAEQTEAYKNEIDIMVNDLMECLNTKLIDYHNMGYIDCPHFIDPRHEEDPDSDNDGEIEAKDKEIDFNLNRLLIRTDKYSLCSIFIMVLFYMVFNFAFWSRISTVSAVLSIMIPIVVGFCESLYWATICSDAEWRMENWRNWLWRPLRSKCQQCWGCQCGAFYDDNKMRVTYNTFWKFYVTLFYLKQRGYDMWEVAYMRPNKDRRCLALSRYQKVLLVNYELFLPIYFSWHIISTAFNDNFTISRLIINYLYGATQFILNKTEILKPLDVDDTFEKRLENLCNDHIYPFATVYDQICNEYEIVSI